MSYLPSSVVSDFHGPVKVATTANITLSGTQVVDSVSLSINDRVLVKDQTVGSQNGIYVVGTPWVRAADANTSGLMLGGLVVAVQSGTTNAGKSFVLVTNSVTLGTTPLRFIATTTSVDARILATSDGTTNDTASVQAAFLVAPAVVYSQGSGAYKLSTTATIGAVGKTHRFAPGAILSVPAGVTLTVAGLIDAPKDQQVFSVASTGAIVLPHMTDVHPGWFGAGGDANYLHTDFKWYTDSSHTVEATDDSLAVRQAFAASAGRSAAGLQTTHHITGPHYLKTPDVTPAGPGLELPFFNVASFTTYRGDGGHFRVGPGLQTADFAIFLGTTDLQSVRFEGLAIHCNSDDTTSPSVGGHTTATAQRNPMIGLWGAHNDDIRIERCLFEKHAGICPVIISDFTSANGDQLAKGVHIEGNTFREVGNVATLIDHIAVYLQADGASITGNVFYNDPATDPHAKDFGSCFQIQGRAITVAGNSFQNVPGLGLFCSFFGINSYGLSFVGNTIANTPIGVVLVQAVGHTMSNVVVSGNAGTMTNCSSGQLEGFVQCFGLNGGDAGFDNVVVSGNSIRFVRDARYNIAEPIALLWDVSIRSMMVEGNDFSDWPAGGLTISPVTGPNPNNKSPSPPWAPATLTTDDLKIWDLHVRNNRFKNCGIGATTVNLACAGTDTPFRRVSVAGNVIEAVDRVLLVSSVTGNAVSPIVVSIGDEVTGSPLPHGIANATKVTISGVNGNVAADTIGYAKVTAVSLACTVTASTDLVHATSHGFTAGKIVTFATTANGLSNGAQYYVLASGLTANDFKVSMSLGGTAVDITSDGSNTVNLAPTTFALYSDAGLTTPVAGTGAYTSGGIVQCPQSGNITTGIAIAGGGLEDVSCDPDSNFFRNITTPQAVSGSPLTRVYAGRQGLTLDDGSLHQGRITFDGSTFSAAITGSFRTSQVYALANSQPIYGINQAGTAVYPLVQLDVNDFVRLASTARVVAIGPIATTSGAAAKDLAMCRGAALRFENNAQSAMLDAIDVDTSNYVRLGFDGGVAGFKAYAAGSAVLQVDGTALALTTATKFTIAGNDVLDVSAGVVRIGFNITTTSTELYQSGSLFFKGNSTGVGFNGTAPAKPNITGALSSVTDPAAKAVLTAIVAALKNASGGVGLVTDGTT